MTFWNQFERGRLLVDASLWSADMTRFAAEIERVDAYVDLYHIDVSDGHYTPGLLFFPDLVAALRPLTRRPFHVHLITLQPALFIDDFIQAGADLVTIHIEAGQQALPALETIRSAGKAAGLSLGLDAPLGSLEIFLPLLDVVLMMATPIGIKGVEPSPNALPRLRAVRTLIEHAGLSDQVKVESDGGLRRHTVPHIYAAGAQVISPGSLIFKSPDLDETTRWLRNLDPQVEQR